MNNPIAAETLSELLYAILTTVIAFLFPIIILMIVYTGFLFVTAQGNPAKIDQARKALVWTLIGGMVILGAYAIATTLDETVHSITSQTDIMVTTYV